MRRDWMAAVIVSAAGMAAPSVAQDRAPQPPASAQPPVAGGDSQPEHAELTIVEHTADGQLKRLEIPAEERAVQVMDLEPAERGRVEKVLAERALVLDEILLKNFDLLTKMHTAAQAGNAAEARTVSGKFLTKLERLTDRGRLEDEIRPELRLDHQQEFTRLITEYRQALVKQAAREAKAEGKEIQPQVLADREMRRGMAREVQRSYDRTIIDKPVEFDALLPGLGLKPEQESKVRNLAAEFAQSHKDQATPAQRRDLLMQILQELDLDQRVKLIKAIRKG
ncbi:MAG: hypothetical protein IT436_01270 [Phycisphaerales bacterium]|nr:hypothetical protein [Phycisphaerales bacterium]